MPDARPILRLGHSPDPDDAFMWWPLFELNGQPARIDTGSFRFVPVMSDIESLNRRAEETGIEASRHQGIKGKTPDREPSMPGCLDALMPLEITAISCAQYPFVKDRYAITSCGASMGDGFGPKLVSSRPMKIDQLKNPDVVLAVPGERTSAFTTTSLMLGKGSFRYEFVPFEQIIQRVRAGEFAAGLIIHEGQLTFEDAGLHLIADVGEWWSNRHHLPLPLGVNVIRRDLEQQFGTGGGGGGGTLQEITATLRRSLDYALNHRQESVAYALNFARDMGAELADRFIGMYVNSWTLDFGPRGRTAVEALLHQAHAAGLTPDPGQIDFVSPRIQESICEAGQF